MCLPPTSFESIPPVQLTWFIILGINLLVFVVVLETNGEIDVVTLSLESNCFAKSDRMALDWLIRSDKNGKGG